MPRQAFPHILWVIGIFAITALALLQGCAGLLSKPEPPNVTVVDLDVSQVNLFEQRYTLTLRLQNTNDTDLNIRGMEYQVLINNQPFASGVNSNAVNVPAFGERIIELDLVSQLTHVLGLLKALGESSNQRLGYRIRGGVKLKNWPTKIPFETTGEMAPSELRGQS